ncbi:MAG: hypothetical protein ACK5FG_07850 [Chryseotalea sp.]|jgi:hypothetical protein
MERVKKLSVAYCKKILESSGKKYSDEETEKIRDLLYKLGELDYRISMDMNKSDNSTSELNKAA